MSPRVSILMSAHNAAQFVGPAIASLLEQSFADFELLIMDDGSGDATAEIAGSIKDSRIRLLSQPNAGLTVALNRLLAQAQGELIARADADDVCNPERLQAQVEYLDRHPEVGVVGSWVRLIDERGNVIGERRLPLTHAQIVRSLRVENPLVHSTVLLRADLLRQAGGYDETRRYAQDYALWCCLAQRTKLANLPRMLAHSRIHGQSIGASHGREQAASRRSIRREYWSGIPPEARSPEAWKADHAAMVAAREHGLEAAEIEALHHEIYNALIVEANLAFGAGRPDVGLRCVYELRLERGAWLLPLACCRIVGFGRFWALLRAVARHKFLAAQEEPGFNW